MDDGSSTPPQLPPSETQSRHTPPKLPPMETESRRSVDGSSTSPQLPPSTETEMGGSGSSTPPQLPANFNDPQQLTNYWSSRLERATAGKPVGHPPGNRLKKISATSISIGPDCRKESIRAEDLALKLSFAKKRLIWEFVEGPTLKENIVVSWSDITAIDAHIPDHQPGLLRIQLGNKPSFFRKNPPQRHWVMISDFTHAHAASHHRIHEAKFRQGLLDAHYAKLMLSDQRLLELSMHPFPAYPSLHQGESSGSGTAPAPCLQQQSLTTTVNNPTPSTAAASQSLSHMQMQMQVESSSSRNADRDHETPLVLASYQNEPLPEELYHEYFNLVNVPANVDRLTMEKENISAHDHQAAPINSLPTLEGSNIDAGDQQR